MAGVLTEKRGVSVIRVEILPKCPTGFICSVMMAMRHMRQWVLASSKEGQAGEKIPVSPFRLNTKTENAPSFFEVMFVVGLTRYRYGFEANSKTVHAEWLLSRANSTRETTLFTRDGETITPGAKFREGSGLEGRTRSKHNVLSKC